MTKVQLMVFKSQHADTGNVNDYVPYGDGRMEWLEAENIKQDNQNKIVLSVPGFNTEYTSFEPVENLDFISKGFKEGYIDFNELHIFFRTRRE